MKALKQFINLSLVYLVAFGIYVLNQNQPELPQFNNVNQLLASGK